MVLEISFYEEQLLNFIAKVRTEYILKPTILNRRLHVIRNDSVFTAFYMRKSNCQFYSIPSYQHLQHNEPSPLENTHRLIMF